MDHYQAMLESGNLAIADMAMKCRSVLETHEHAMVSVSGGADSDVMIDLIENCRDGLDTAVTYVWFNTGLEYKATRDHLKFLENKYGIEIERRRPKKTIPTCVKEYGQPFLSKQVSEYIARLQKHGFKWEDEPFDVLLERYPRCRSSLRWWCGVYDSEVLQNGSSKFNISRNRFLKDFMKDTPPDSK